MRRIVPVLLVATAFAGCVGVDGAAGLPDDGRLAATWDAGDPSAHEVVSLDGKPWAKGLHAHPVVADVDGDGDDEILVHGGDRKVRVFDGSGKLLASIPVTYPPSWRAGDVLNSPAAGSLDGSGHHIVVAGPAAVVTAWTVSPGKTLQLSKAWETTTDACHRGAGMDAPPVLAELDGTPGLEVLVHTEQLGFYALDGDGSVLWKHCWAGGNSAPVADDLDGDGDVEAVFASDSGFISVIDGKTGNPEWTFDAGDPRYGIAPASVVTAPTIADIDGKGPKEVLFTARHAPSDDADLYESFHMAIFAVHQNPKTYEAELLWLRQPGWAHPMSNTRLVVEDVDQDGRMDIFGMDWNTIGHNPGAWEPLNESHVFRLDSYGRDVWVRSIPAWWSNKDIAVVDADGDGKMEVLVSSPRGDQDGVWRLDAAKGTPEGFLGAGGWTLSTGPVVTSQGVVVAANAPDGDRSALIIYDLEFS